MLFFGAWYTVYCKRAQESLVTDYHFFDLFRFTAPQYQTVIPSVIHQEDTIATIRARQGHFQHTETKMDCLWGLFCHHDKQNKLDAKCSSVIFLCPYLLDLSTNGKLKKNDVKPLAFRFFFFFFLLQLIKNNECKRFFMTMINMIINISSISCISLPTPSL